MIDHTLEDWYKVRGSDFRKNGGASLLEYFKNRTGDVVQHIYSEHQWLPFLFAEMPRGMWEEKRNHVLFLEYVTNYFDSYRAKGTCAQATTKAH